MGFIDQLATGHVLHALDEPEQGEPIETILQSVRDTLHAGQAAFVDDQATEVLGLTAGYGAGKTWALCAKALALAVANQGFQGAVLEPTAVLVRDIWQQDFERFLETFNVPYSFRASPLPEYLLHLPGGDTRILCRSFSNWQRLIGLNLAWVLVDEIDTVAQDICDRAFPKLLGRLRAGNVRQFAAASTPEGFRWLWRTFASDDSKGHAGRRLLKLRTLDNPHLPPDFVERLEANCDPRLLAAYRDGEFVNLTTGSVYDRFSRELHLRPAPPLADDPLHIGIDFNIANMTAVVCLRHNGGLHVIDEIHGAHDTDELGRRLRSRYPDRRLYGYPDASGGARSTNASQTDIQILESYGIANQSPRANPPVRDRVNAVQMLLENGKGEHRLWFDPACRNVIQSIELQCWTDKGEPDKDSGHDHACDSLGYVVWRLFNPLHARAGRGTGVRVY